MSSSYIDIVLSSDQHFNCSFTTLDILSLVTSYFVVENRLHSDNADSL